MISHVNFIATIALFLIVSGKGDLFSQNLMQYTSDEYHYSMLIPEEWERMDEVRNKRISLVLRSKDGATLSVSFYTGKNIDKDSFQEQYFQSLLAGNSNAQLEEKGVLVTREGEVDYLLMEYAQDGELISEKACFYLLENEIVVVSGRYTAEQFHQLLPLFNKIFKSFILETDQKIVEYED